MLATSLAKALLEGEGGIIFNVVSFVLFKRWCSESIDRLHVGSSQLV
jgi:hypothetical protein